MYTCDLMSYKWKDRAHRDTKREDERRIEYTAHTHTEGGMIN